MSSKGIFCIEGLWNSDLSQKSTVLPVLEMLSINNGTRFIHQHTATPAEFEFFLNKWKTRQNRYFPILYLAFHGDKGSLKIGDYWYSLHDLSLLLEHSCTNSIIIFASCKTMDVNQSLLESFLKKTHALALFGYTKMVNWMTAAACELLLLSSLQQARFSSRGVTFEKSRIRLLDAFYTDLGFSMITQKHIELDHICRKADRKRN